MNLESFIQTAKQRFATTAQYYLNQKTPAEKLRNCMNYAVNNGGKRIRPLFVYATGLALGAEWEELDAPACAIELIHAYSLTHDDLPAMDNSDFRRGQPTCHKKYDEATAILAGDALQTLAFEVLVSYPAKLSPEQRLEMIKILSSASGLHGMAGGQALDLAGSEDILTMYRLKTGALLKTSVILGALAAPKVEPQVLQTLENYADAIGLAFQLQDDLLDYEDAEITGKPQGLDVINQKKTYCAVIGVKKAQEKVQQLFNSALESLEMIKGSEVLAGLTHYLIKRKS